MSIDWETQTYYEILEISQDAHPNEIRQAYQRAKSTYSQDNPALYTVFTKDETKQLLSLIEEAYSVLSNQVTREAYDQRIHRSKPEEDTSTKKNDHPADDFINQALQGAQNGSADPELPNFEFDEEQNSSEQKAPAQQTSTSSQNQNNVDVPEGHAKTSVSVYRVDPEVEEQIANQNVFDGEFLKLVREYKKVDIARVSEITRISKAYLNAVEANDYSQLPAPVFVRGFVVQIARILELDEKQVASSYIHLLKSRT